MRDSLRSMICNIEKGSRMNSADRDSPRTNSPSCGRGRGDPIVYQEVTVFLSHFWTVGGFNASGQTRISLFLSVGTTSRGFPRLYDFLCAYGFSGLFFNRRPGIIKH